MLKPKTAPVWESTSHYYARAGAFANGTPAAEKGLRRPLYCYPTANASLDAAMAYSRFNRAIKVALISAGQTASHS
jgi:hypothetical protein